MSEPVYYDGTKILSMKDLDGQTPEIFMVTTNRTGGKTTYFSRLCVNRFLDKGEKFMLLYRFSYELDDCADKFFKDIHTLFFPTHNMTGQKRGNGLYVELYLDNKSCGYAVAMNNADAIKKFSHFFSDVCRILFDEFQSETNHYCPRELTKFQSIHTSVARGQGQQVRYVPVFMLSNPVSLINPYYAKFKISARLKKDTHYLRGHGFIVEQGFVESASNAMLESGFNRAFAEDAYQAYASQNVYLNDNESFIEKPKGKGRYLATLRFNGQDFGIREFINEGIIYCDDRPDSTYPMKLCVTTNDHKINYVMLKRNDIFIQDMRFFFERGCYRFKDLTCKEAVLSALSYY